jgi:zinc protease
MMPRIVFAVATLAGCAAIAAGSAAAQAPAARPAPTTLPPVVETVVAGIPVVFRPTRANEVVAVRLYIRGGAAALTPQTAGIERLMGEMGPRGTAKYDRAGWAARATAAGVEYATDAHRDFTVLSVRGVRAHWHATWDLFTEAVLHPTFPERELGLVRDQVLNDLRTRQDDPDRYLQLLADSTLYRGHPYAVDPAGTVGSVERIAPADLAAWHRRRMTKGNLALVVVGDVPRADLEAKIRAAFGALPSGTGGAPPAAVPKLAGGAAPILVAERELPTNYVMGVVPMPGIGDPDYAAMRVAMVILSDRLFEEVRTKRNLTYAVGAWLGGERANHGALYVTAVQPDTTLRVMLHEVERLKSEPITQERLAENVNTFLTGYWLRQEANMDQAAMLGSYELLGGGWERAFTFADQVRAVTPADIRRVAGRYLTKLRFAVVGDPTKLDPRIFGG